MLPAQALLIRTLICCVEKAERVAAMRSAGAEGVDMSARMHMAWEPAALISLTSASAGFSEDSET